jgi:hypothetical protein
MEMTFRRGYVTNVYDRASGSTLVENAAIGATEVWVSDPFDFNVNGGTLVFDDGAGILIAYSSVDPLGVYDAAADYVYKHRIALTAPLATAQNAGTPVLVYPYASKRLAYVSLGEVGQDVRVEIPFSMKEKFATGVRENDDREAVAIEEMSGVWQITNVVDEIPVIPSNVIDFDNSGVVFDPTEPPAASPTPIPFAGSGAAIIRWTNAEFAEQYDIHISTSNASAPDSSTLAETNAHSPTWIATMPNGSAIPTDSDVYFAIIASNAIGAAPASAWVAGRAGLLEDTILSASVAYIQTVITELVETAGLQIGDHTWNETTGLTIPDVVNFPASGGDAALAQIWAKMIARSLTVENYLSIRGANNEFSMGSTTKLGQGVTDPGVAPAVTEYWPISPIGTAVKYDGRTRVAGDPTWAGSSRYLVVGATGKTVRVWENGTAVGNTWSPELTTEQIRGICKGYNCWWIATVIPGDNRYVILYKVSDTLPASGWTTQSFLLVSMGGTGGADGWLVNVAAPLDAGVMFDDNGFGKVAISHPGSSGVTTYREYSIAVDGTPTLREMGDFGVSVLDGMVYQAVGSNNPYGQKVLYIGGSGSGLSSPTGFRVEAVTLNPATGVFTSLERYDLSNNMRPVSLTHIGSSADADGALLASLAQEGSELPARVTKYSKYMNWSSHEFMYTWYDSDSGGTGTHETKASPTYTNPAGSGQAQKMARSWMLVTPSPANDTGDPDAPNSHRIYCASSVGGTKRLQGATTSASGTFYFQFSSASSTVPPASSNFTGSTPAVIKSEKTDALGSIIQLKGDGSGRVGPLSWDSSGNSTRGGLQLIGRDFVAPLVQNVGMAINTTYTVGTWDPTTSTTATRAFIECTVTCRCPSGNQAIGWTLRSSTDNWATYTDLAGSYVHNFADASQQIGGSLSAFVDFAAGADVQFRLMAATGGGAGNSYVGSVNMHVSWFR